MAGFQPTLYGRFWVTPEVLPSLVEAPGICFFLSRLFEIMRPPLFWKQPPVLPWGQKPYACYPCLPELAGRSLD